MLTRIQLTLIAALILGVALLVVAIRGEQPTIAAVVATFGIVVAVASGAVFLLDRYAWWWPVLRGWLVSDRTFAALGKPRSIATGSIRRQG
jgi:hypothetical protein